MEPIYRTDHKCPRCGRHGAERRANPASPWILMECPACWARWQAYPDEAEQELEPMHADMECNQTGRVFPALVDLATGSGQTGDGHQLERGADGTWRLGTSAARIVRFLI